MRVTSRIRTNFIDKEYKFFISIIYFASLLGKSSTKTSTARCFCRFPTTPSPILTDCPANAFLADPAVVIFRRVGIILGYVQYMKPFINIEQIISTKFELQKNVICSVVNVPMRRV